MKKCCKRAFAMTLAFAMAVSFNTGSADAAKKVQLSNKKVNVRVGKTKKVTVKNARKTTKVTWKVKNASVARITAKVTKGKKASATIKGIAPGSTVLTAKIKKGGAYSCKVYVTGQEGSSDNNGTAATQTPDTGTAAATASPAATQTATPGKDASVYGPSSTPAATAQPTEIPPSPTPTRTPVPSPKPTQVPWNYASSPQPLSFDGKTDDDPAKSTSEKDSEGNLIFKGSPVNTRISLPGCDKETDRYVPKDAYIIVEVKGTYEGDKGFEIIVGKGKESYLVNDGIIVKDNKFAFPADHEKGEFSEVFCGKVSEDADSLSIVSDEALDGAVKIKSIEVRFCGFLPKFTEEGELVIPGQEPYDGYKMLMKIPFTEEKKANDVVGIEVMINDSTGGRRNYSWNLFSPGRNDGDNKFEPYFNAGVFGNLVLVDKAEDIPEVKPAKTAYAVKIDKAVEISENMTDSKVVEIVDSEIWKSSLYDITDHSTVFKDDEDGKKFIDYVSVQSAQTAFLWDANNLYIAVSVVDDNFSTDEESVTYGRDGIEIFFDETRADEISDPEKIDENGYVFSDYDTDCFQYRVIYNGSLQEFGRIVSDDIKEKYKVQAVTGFFRLPEVTEEENS